MAVSFDAFTNGTATSAGSMSWNHAPTAPKGVIVAVVINGATESVTTVSYGGVSLSEISGSPNVNSAGEASTVSVWFLGSGIPGGVVVAINKSGTSETMQAGCWTVASGGGDIEIVDIDISILSTSSANPSATLSLSGKTSFCCEAFHSGQNAPSGITPLGSWTSGLEHDFGTQTAGWYRYNTIGTADVTIGWTQTADDANCIGIAVREIPAATRRIFITG